MQYKITYRFYWRHKINGTIVKNEAAPKEIYDSKEAAINDIIDQRLKDGQLNTWVIFVSDIKFIPVGRLRVE